MDLLSLKNLAQLASAHFFFFKNNSTLLHSIPCSRTIYPYSQIIFVRHNGHQNSHNQGPRSHLKLLVVEIPAVRGLTLILRLHFEMGDGVLSRWQPMNSPLKNCQWYPSFWPTAYQNDFLDHNGPGSQLIIKVAIKNGPGNQLIQKNGN